MTQNVDVVKNLTFLVWLRNRFVNCTRKIRFYPKNTTIKDETTTSGQNFWKARNQNLDARTWLWVSFLA